MGANKSKKVSPESTQALRPTFIPRDQRGPIYELDALDIADEFSDRSYHFVLKVLDRILTLSEYSSNNKIAYQLQSGSYTQDIINERNLLSKFESRGMFRNLGEDGIFGIATLSELNIGLIKDVVDHIHNKISGVMSSEEFERLKKSQENEVVSIKKDDTVKLSKKPTWRNDFVWNSDRFVFGEYGMTPSFKSKQKKLMFKELTNAKGNWVTVHKLKELVDKNDDYIRPTLGQIRRSFSKEIRKHIEIVSTTDDDFDPKPIGGAYRIKFTQNSL